MAFWSPSKGSWAPGGPHMAAKAARKPKLGGSGDALGALLAALGSVLVPLGPLLGSILASRVRLSGPFWASSGLLACS